MNAHGKKVARKKFNFVVGKKSFKNPIFKYRWYFLSERKNSNLKNSLRGKRKVIKYPISIGIIFQGGKIQF